MKLCVHCFYIKNISNTNSYWSFCKNIIWLVGWLCFTSHRQRGHLEMAPTNSYCSFCKNIIWLVGWLCFTSHRQRGHLETAPPFTVSCQGREARFIHRSNRESNRGPSHDIPLHYCCATQAPHVIWNINLGIWIIILHCLNFQHVLKFTFRCFHVEVFDAQPRSECK